MCGLATLVICCLDWRTHTVTRTRSCDYESLPGWFRWLPHRSVWSRAAGLQPGRPGLNAGGVSS